MDRNFIVMDRNFSVFLRESVQCFLLAHCALMLESPGSTAQPVVTDQPIRRGKNLAVGRQSITQDEPRRAPFAVLKIFEVPTIDRASHSA